MERHARSAAQQILDTIGVFHTGQCHQNARLTLAGDECLGDACFINAAANDFDRAEVEAEAAAWLEANK